MFGNQRIRLLRESPWGSVQELAEELFAMFGPDQALEHDGPITLNIPEDQTVAPITLNFGGDPPFPMIRIQRRGEDYGELRFPLAQTDENGQQTVIGTGGGGTTRAVFHGQVVSGSGTSYTVNVYESGVTGSATSRSVTQVQTGPDIPADTWAVVVKDVNGRYSMDALPRVYGAEITSVVAVNEYICTLYPGGFGATASSGEWTVKQMLISGSVALPTGYRDIAVRLGSTYWFQAPVFMGAEA